jgi:hypothetical protein
VQASPSILHPLQIKHSVAAGLSEQGQFAEKLKRTMETVCNKMAIEKFFFGGPNLMFLVQKLEILWNAKENCNRDEFSSSVTNWHV